MDEVKIGFWSDYDKPWASRTILTLTNTQAGYIIAAISFLLASVILPILWRILVLGIYLSRHTRLSDQTYELKQRRILLRNAPLPGGAILALTEAFWDWSQGSATNLQRKPSEFLVLLLRSATNLQRKPFQFLFLLVLSTASIVVIGVCGIFVPPLFVSDATGDVIALAKPGSCGFLSLFDSVAEFDEVAASASRELDETVDARGYAAEFYGNESSGRGLQSPFPVLALPYQVDNLSSCPFSEELCLLGSDGSITFDTGLIDSHKHLGINAQAKDRVNYRWKSTCTPLKLDPLVNIVKDGERDGFRISEDAPLFDFYLGPHENQNYTFSWKQLTPANRIGYHVQ